MEMGSVGSSISESSKKRRRGRARGGQITITTSYQHGVRLAVPGMTSKMQLPLLAVTDNGAGVPDELMDHLFDAL